MREKSIGDDFRDLDNFRANIGKYRYRALSFKSEKKSISFNYSPDFDANSRVWCA